MGERSDSVNIRNLESKRYSDIEVAGNKTVSCEGEEASIGRRRYSRYLIVLTTINLNILMISVQELAVVNRVFITIDRKYKSRGVFVFIVILLHYEIFIALVHFRML